MTHAIAVQQPTTLKDPDAQAALRSLDLDALVVVAYGLILPPAVLALPRLGCLNVHASLLPRWRGAAPIQRAIMAGDAQTGVCIMQMDAGLDTGPVHSCRRTPIAAADTFLSVHDRLAEMGADALCEVLDAMAHGRARAVAQAEQGVTYAPKISKADCRIDWCHPAAQIGRVLRALDPAPGAQTLSHGQHLKLWRGYELAFGANAAGVPPGTVLALGPDGIDVQCAEGVLRVTELQRAGGRRMRAEDFQRGFRLAVGDRFGD